MKKKKKILIGLLICCVAVIVATYAGMTMYYSTHFFSGSMINGIDCTGKTVDEVKEIISDEIMSYTVTLNKLDQSTEVITAPQIKMQYVEDGSVEELKEEQNPFNWISSFSREKDYAMSATTTYDKNALADTVSGLDCFKEENVTKPKDAGLQENAQGYYEVTPEVGGNALDQQKVVEALTQAIDTGKTEISLVDSECYLKPAVYSNDEGLKNKMDQYNAYMGINITYDFKGRTEAIDREVIKAWISEDEEGNLSLSEGKVEEFVSGLAKKYDTFGLSRQFKTSGGSTITLNGGDYGWCISKKKETAALVEMIKTGKSEENRKPIYLYEGKSRAENDIGGTYVEISISEQRMWCYKDGALLVDTPVVTGNVSKAYDTPAGACWAIDAKKRDAILTGEGYSTPVTYWMPFNGNVGIHDADTWRSSYGGDIYLTSGSHGCVNTPYGNAEKIYNNIEIGTPVIVY